jgi:ribonuclease HI
VFTDGAASPNPGPGGWGAVYVVDGEVVDHAYGSDPDTTNNRMELTALLHGIELVPEGRRDGLHRLEPRGPDRQRVGRRLGEAGLEAQDRPGREPRPRPAALRADARRPEIELVWIKAHAGNRWNEYADSLATAYARDEL